MRTNRHRFIVATALVTLFGFSSIATAQTQTEPKLADAVSTFEWTDNMRPIGYSARNLPLTGTGSGVFNSDLAFWGKHAIQGTYSGFRIIDIGQPSRPREIVNYEDCVAPTSTLGSQGDIVVWENILVRAWDAPRGSDQLCGGILTPAGQEGSHVFDISDPANPVAMAFVNTQPCGSHTITGVPDPENDRLLIYSSPSSNNAACLGFHVIEVPFGNLAGASLVRFEPSGLPFAGGALVNLVDVHDGAAAGTYAASGSQWHPDATAEGVTGPLALVNAGANPDFPAALPSEGCGPLIGFPAGSIALVDRGTCPFLLKTINAEAAGAIGVIVMNNSPATPIQMGGETHDVSIPSGMVSQADGALIRANLPATGTLRRHPDALNVARACHDTAVILGDAMQVACAGGNGVSSWTIDPAKGGSLEDPELLYSVNHGTGIGHTAAFTWDGKYIVFGHEPGGGGQAQCQATSSVFNRTIFFLDAETGLDEGHFVHPRPQTATENCTWHNGNVVPTPDRYLWVSGNYQSGVSVVDFTDFDNIHEIAYADPAPLSPTTLIGGGDWSSYWYNGHIYESDMKRGLIIWNLREKVKTRALPHFNPQTQEMTIDGPGGGGGH